VFIRRIWSPWTTSSKLPPARCRKFKCQLCFLPAKVKENLKIKSDRLKFFLGWFSVARIRPRFKKNPQISIYTC
jgi:hypothetical protein